MKKMNNKGFSLVELIVVVLIMAIIAVALAPQVMRWVENSRKSNDIEAYGSLVNALQVAGTDEDVLKNFPAAGVTVTFTASGVGGVSESHLQAAVVRTLPELTFNAAGTSDAMKVQGDWSGTGCMNASNQFVITVAKSSDGSGLSVTQTNKPKKVFS
ncbi:MAG: type II secretion system GspH family protein [Lachnospiraceae bacterium]|nr:type II secretion system GspH family protein [Lachnospiraceae bacterium]